MWPALRAIRLASTKVTAENVKILRQQTSLTIGLCRKALEAANNDITAATKWLQENEQARAEMAKAKLNARETSQGRIALSRQATRGAMVELNCETDFVARNEKFATLAEAVLGAVNSLPPAKDLVLSLPAATVLPLKTAAGPTVEQSINSALGSLGENITFRRAVAVNTEGGFVGGYLHNNGSYGALVSLAPAAGATALPQNVSAVADLVAQHVVAMDPPTLAALVDQPYLFDSSRKVADMLKTESAALGAPAVVTGFVRWGGGKEVVGLNDTN